MYALVLVVAIFGVGSVLEITVPGYYNEAHCQAIAGDVSVDRDGDSFLHVNYKCEEVK